MTDLDTFREQLNQIDLELVRLLGQRLGICRQVAEWKLRSDVAMMQPARVEAVKSRCAEAGREHGLNEAFVRRLYGLVIEEACRLEDEVMSPANRTPSDSSRFEGWDRTRGLRDSGLEIDHVAIAVLDLEKAIEHYTSRLGFEVIVRRETKGKVSGMVSAELAAGGIRFVLVQGTCPESNVSRYIEAYGQGVQHVALRVTGIEGVYADLSARGCELLTEPLRAPGLVQLFTRRDSASGMQLEIAERRDTDGFDATNVQRLFEAMEADDTF